LDTKEIIYNLLIATIVSVGVGSASWHFNFYPMIKSKWKLKVCLDKLNYDVNEFKLSIENKSGTEFSNKLLMQIYKDFEEIQNITLNNKGFEDFNEKMVRINEDLALLKIKLENWENEEVLYEFKQISSDQLSASPLEFFEIVIENNINIFINVSIILFFVFLFVVFYILYFNNKNIKKSILIFLFENLTLNIKRKKYLFLILIVFIIFKNLVDFYQLKSFFNFYIIADLFLNFILFFNNISNISVNYIEQFIRFLFEKISKKLTFLLNLYLRYAYKFVSFYILDSI